MRLVLAALALAGCGPSALWRAHSPDLLHHVEVRADGDRERVLVDGGDLGTFEEVAPGSAVFVDGGVRFVVRDGSAFRIVGGAELPAFLDVELPLRAMDGALVASAADRDGWHLVFGDALGPPFPGSAADVRWVAGRLVYVARSGASERVVDGDAVGPPFDDVRLVSIGDSGRAVVYAGVLGAREHLVAGTTDLGDHDDVLELAVAESAPTFAAIVGEGEACELLVSDGASLRSLGVAAMLTHLRISDGGAVACLRPADDGLSIALLVNGEVVAEHRRIDGERLGFAGETLVWLAEDAQGIVVRTADSESERFEDVEGPVLAPSLGFIGRRNERSEVWVAGALVADEPYATELRVGPEARYAFVARRPDGRFVVTARGSWPVPRFFVDTLRLDATGEHWAALVPDAAEREVSVWVDGVPVATVPLAEILGPALASGADAEDALFTVVEAVLARELP